VSLILVVEHNRSENGHSCRGRFVGHHSVIMSFKPRLHDASWIARVKPRECARRRFMHVMESSTGRSSKRVVTSITLLA
jgi:hypothetical protein